MTVRELPTPIPNLPFMLVAVASWSCILLGAALATTGDKICTTVDCPNEHYEVKDTIDGTIHRYSKNAPNFHDAKIKVFPGNHGGVKQLVPVQSKDGQNIAENTARQFERRPVENATGSLDGVRDASNTPGQHDRVLSGHGNQHQVRSEQQHLSHPLQSLPANRPSEPAEVHAEGSTPVRAVEDGIFWSALVEGAIPPGLSETEVDSWMSRVRLLKVRQIEDASLQKCGSNMNRHVVFEDGMTTCARYRYPMKQFVMGDLYCYYLSRLLGMRNVPAVTLSRVSNDSTSQWSLVKDDITRAGWVNGSTASFSLWINDLGEAHLPEILFTYQHSTLYPTSPGFEQLNLTQLVELAQYSDLIVFDYITSHLDRMTIRKNAVKYYGEDWLYGGSIHNLAKHRSNGGLWFLDNENGIYNAYTVAYADEKKTDFIDFHEELLRTMCMFRRTTVEKVRALALMDDPYAFLNTTVYAGEPVLTRHIDYLPNVSEKFKQRLKNVVKWITECTLHSGG